MRRGADRVLLGGQLLLYFTQSMQFRGLPRSGIHQTADAATTAMHPRDSSSAGALVPLRGGTSDCTALALSRNQ